jgi:hypothetical protein
MLFPYRPPRTLPLQQLKGANLIYYPAQGVRSCTNGSIYNGLNVGIAWVEFELATQGGWYWQMNLAKAMGCNLVRPMQDGGGASWSLLYNSGGDYYANRAIAFQRSRQLAIYAASLGMFYYPTLNCCTYNGYLAAPNGGGGFGAIADHAAAFCVAHRGLPNIIGIDVAQEFFLMSAAGVTTQNSNGDPTQTVNPASKLSSANKYALVAQIVIACRAATPEIAITASYGSGDAGSGVFSDPEVALTAGSFDFMDYHIYYDPASGDSSTLYSQAGTSGKPFIIGEYGQNIAAGQPAQVTRANAVYNNVVAATYAGQPGCRGLEWWAVAPQDTTTTDDFGAYDASGNARSVESAIAAQPSGTPRFFNHPMRRHAA